MAGVATGDRQRRVLTPPFCPESSNGCPGGAPQWWQQADRSHEPQVQAGTITTNLLMWPKAGPAQRPDHILQRCPLLRAVRQDVSVAGCFATASVTPNTDVLFCQTASLWYLRLFTQKSGYVLQAEVNVAEVLGQWLMNFKVNPFGSRETDCQTKGYSIQQWTKLYQSVVNVLSLPVISLHRN